MNVYEAIASYVKSSCDLAVVQATAPRDTPRVNRATSTVAQAHLQLLAALANDRTELINYVRTAINVHEHIYHKEQP